MSIVWSDELNTGLTEIDRQHRRIIDFINKLETAKLQQDRKLVSEVVTACVDYAATHFSYEEQLQKDAGYEYLSAHKKVHELFTQRVSEYQRRLEAGDDIVDELCDMLNHWLVSHIRLDDADFVGAVKLHQATMRKRIRKRSKTGKGILRNLFG